MQWSSPLALHTFSGEAKGHVVHFLAIRMDGGLFLWAGTDGKLPALAVAMPTKYVSLPRSFLPFKILIDLVGTESPTLITNLLAKRECGLEGRIFFRQK
uniref:Uncharacterized protein n=1 Tax=Eptatretus burgeri TaxID=7764 RepID=A0A8C4PZD9_EPTBU